MTKSVLVVVTFLSTLFAINTRDIVVSYSVASRWLGNADQRLPNIRIISEECRAPFIRRFIALQDLTKPTMLIFGDSQSFNKGVPAKSTWPARFNELADLRLNIVNLAVVDGRPPDTRFIAAQLSGKADLAVVNLNQAHFNGLESRKIPPLTEAPFEFVRCIVSMRRFLVTTELPLPDAKPVRERYRKATLAKDRYEMRLDSGVLRSTVEAVALKADRTIVYITPNNIDVFGDYGYDVQRFKDDSAQMLETCAETVATCFDLSSRMSKANFYDIVHLNTAGNDNLAKLLLKEATRADTPLDERHFTSTHRNSTQYQLQSLPRRGLH
ncbi:MAG: hypothetical protein IPL91_04320 [Hyphomicrobium sp.]|nr:hypothetical protein [Hyphomicrobium sp.]